MQKLFGTDGIRGRVNQDPITPEMALHLGKAALLFFGPDKPTSETPPQFIIGWDTRASSPMLAKALAAGISAMGGEVVLIGELPTPAVSFYTRRESAAVAGIMITASHNPYTDNGIKFFEGDGFKQTMEREKAFEALILSRPLFHIADSPLDRIGRIENQHSSMMDQYKTFLVQGLDSEMKSGRPRIVLDCANGATSRIAPAVFEKFANVLEVLSNTPDGLNINRQCGSEYPQHLARVVRSLKADMGFCFDGDGDRLIAVDEIGEILSGDQVMAILAKDLQFTHRLGKGGVVSTVMSNLGFSKALKFMGIDHHVSAVGDRQVVTLMRAQKALLGGEDSGHVVMLDQHTTGDGIYSALKLLEAVQRSGRSLSQLKQVMQLFPQMLINVDVGAKPPLETVTELQKAIQTAEVKLGGEGRVLIRYSGTQMKCRVMVEGPTGSQTEAICQQLVEVVKKTLG